jgi:hypothetical protein
LSSPLPAYRGLALLLYSRGYHSGRTACVTNVTWLLAVAEPCRARPRGVFNYAWRAAPMGLDQPVLSVITVPVVVMMSPASPPEWTSAVRPPCTLPRDDSGDPCRIRPPRTRGSRPSGQVSSLLSHATSSRLGECLRLQASLPARGRGLLLLLPSKGEGPSITRQCLVGLFIMGSA